MNSNKNTVVNLLKYTFGFVPIVAGFDKFTNLLTDWPQYLSPRDCRDAALGIRHVYGPDRNYRNCRGYFGAVQNQDRRGDRGRLAGIDRTDLDFGRNVFGCCGTRYRNGDCRVLIVQTDRPGFAKGQKLERIPRNCL